MKDYKILAKKIYERTSVRTYTDGAVALLDEGADLMSRLELKALFPDIRFKIVLLKDGDGVKNTRSKYCFGFYTDENVGGAHENVGFIGQQLSLELQAIGVGTCWWGMKKPDKAHKTLDGLTCVITMSAGLPNEPLTQAYPDGFKRKSMDEICLGDERDELLEAVRIAPSAVNKQPWLVEKKGNVYSFYLSKPKALIDRMIGDTRKVDMGIAMSHLYIKAKAEGHDPVIKADGQNLLNATYSASISI